jgi:hypothetical protein
VARFKVPILLLALSLSGASRVYAQGALVASVGKLFGGDTQASGRTWAIGVGGAGAHAIGSELEYSQTSHVTDLNGNVSKVLSLMASIYVAPPVSKVKPTVFSVLDSSVSAPIRAPEVCCRTCRMTMWDTARAAA